MYNPFDFIKDEMNSYSKYNLDTLSELYLVDLTLTLESLKDIQFHRDVNVPRIFITYEAINILYSSLLFDFNSLLLKTGSTQINKFDNLFHEISVKHCSLYSQNVSLVPKIGVKVLKDYLLITRVFLHSTLAQEYNLESINLTSTPF